MSLEKKNNNFGTSIKITRAETPNNTKIQLVSRFKIYNCWQNETIE